MAKVEQIAAERDGHSAVFQGSWYRGKHTNFIASKAELRAPDAVDKFILQGWLPKAPFLDKRTPITAFGSCFAAHLTRHLAERGYNLLGRELDRQAHIVRFGEGMVNSFAIRQQF